MIPDSSSYTGLLADLKARIQSAQTRAALAVNAELVRLYWEIGQTILQRQQAEGWGTKVVDRLAGDLKDSFPNMKGFSSRNLKYMRTFAERCPDLLIGQQPAAQLPWFHLVTLLTQVGGDSERAWLASHTAQQGWSRATLQAHIKNRLFERQGQAVTNFEVRLPASQAALAQESLKDPYLFDFLGLGEDALERASSTSTCLPWTPRSRPPKTSPPSAFCSARRRTASWPNTPCPALISPSAWRNTNSCGPFPSRSIPPCRRSKPSKRN